MRQPCKAKDFLSKEANQNKAVEFRLSSGDELVPLMKTVVFLGH